MTDPDSTQLNGIHLYIRSEGKDRDECCLKSVQKNLFKLQTICFNGTNLKLLMQKIEY